MKRNIQKINQHGVLGIYIPMELTKDLNLKAGNQLDFSVQDGKIILTPVHTVPEMPIQQV
ncbi:MAG: AbrB/MazE/SpoVT family DNA-binding domain-containing protein [Candidatus Methanoperedens sp.]|nr:AbrB/MazE/SpoVT family DNA-binding domain-containing protein [Candidatus Methanoperedens sp.]CAG0949011.1 hypothetical protein METP1_00074 [Methanosarcinales archaeon]